VDFILWLDVIRSGDIEKGGCEELLKNKRALMRLMWMFFGLMIVYYL